MIKIFISIISLLTAISFLVEFNRTSLLSIPFFIIFAISDVLIRKEYNPKKQRQKWSKKPRLESRDFFAKNSAKNVEIAKNSELMLSSKLRERAGKVPIHLPTCLLF